VSYFIWPSTRKNDRWGAYSYRIGDGRKKTTVTLLAKESKDLSFKGKDGGIRWEGADRTRFSKFEQEGLAPPQQKKKTPIPMPLPRRRVVKIAT